MALKVEPRRLGRCRSGPVVDEFEVPIQVELELEKKGRVRGETAGDETGTFTVVSASSCLVLK